MSSEKIGIDYGLEKMFDPGFPTPNVKQSSQPMRDNWEVIQVAIENLQSKQIEVTGDLSGLSSCFNSGTETVNLELLLNDTGVNPGVYHNPKITVDSKGRILSAESGISGPTNTTKTFFRDMTGVWNLDVGSINPVPDVWNDIETVRFWPCFDQSIYHTLFVGDDYDTTKPTILQTIWVVPEADEYYCDTHGNPIDTHGNMYDIHGNPSGPIDLVELGLEWKVNNGSWQSASGINIPDFNRGLSVATNGLQKINWIIPPGSFSACDIVQFRLSRFAGKTPINPPNPCDFPRANKPLRLNYPTPSVIKEWYGEFVYEPDGTRGTEVDTYDSYINFVSATLQQPKDTTSVFCKDLTSVIWNLDVGTEALPNVRYDMEVAQFKFCLDTVIYHDMMIPDNIDVSKDLIIKTLWSPRRKECNKIIELGFCYQVNGNGFTKPEIKETINTEDKSLQIIQWIIPAGTIDPCDVLTICLGRYSEPLSGIIDINLDACPSHPEPLVPYKGKGNGRDNYEHEVDFYGGQIYQET